MPIREACKLASLCIEEHEGLVQGFQVLVRRQCRLLVLGEALDDDYRNVVDEGDENSLE